MNYYPKTKAMKKILTTVCLFAVALMANAANEVSEATEWTFDNLEVKTIADVHEINGLFVRAKEGHEASIVDSKVKGNLSDGTRYNVKKGLKLMSNKSFKVSSNTRVNNPAESGTDRCIGIKTTKAGTLYLVVRTKTKDVTRTIDLYFNGVIVKQLNAEEVAESTDNLAIIEYKAEKGGTFFLGGGAEIIVCYAKFSPIQ